MVVDKIRISAVSYLNTKPFIYGIGQTGLESECDVKLEIPSVCAQKLMEDKADIGLIPAAVIPDLEVAHIITDYCIGAVGAVGSVMLYSEVPMDKINTILLDYQSRTSVALTRVLARELWKITPQWQQARPGYEQEISGSTAGVIIGDRTFTLGNKYAYVWDLSEEWMKLTGLPFVFACWVANKQVPASFIEKLNGALAHGIAHRSEVAAMWQEKYPGVDANDYLVNKISYRLDNEKREGLRRFLAYLK